MGAARNAQRGRREGEERQQRGGVEGVEVPGGARMLGCEMHEERRLIEQLAGNLGPLSLGPRLAYARQHTFQTRGSFRNYPPPPFPLPATLNPPVE